MDTKRSAYNVWLCGECDSHTVELDKGDHLCETLRGVVRPRRASLGGR